MIEWPGTVAAEKLEVLCPLYGSGRGTTISEDLAFTVIWLRDSKIVTFLSADRVDDLSAARYPFGNEKRNRDR